MSIDTFDNEGEKITKKPIKKNSTTPVLDNFSRDLTKLAEEGKLDAVIGRDDEIKRITQILSRKKKNNVVIVGDAGVGKSALIEKLAINIKKGNCPTNLLDKRVVSLDLTSLVAGTKYRGQFEERMKAILHELAENPGTIVFIDELHTMIGAGNASGSMDAANVLKPALARGEIQCIGATTFDEYKKHIEKDAALVRRFQKLILKEPSVDETIDILNNIKSSYEDFHNVKYDNGVIEVIVKVSDRYISDRHFPDKAIDVMDELGSEKRISIKIPKHLEKLKEQYDEIVQKKRDVVKSQNYELAAKLRDEEKKTLIKIETEKQKIITDSTKTKKIVSIDDVYVMISDMSGVPISKLDQNETEKLLNMSTTLNEKVIGQTEAIDIITRAIKRNRVGIKRANKPIGSFIFVGSTGVGKTFLAKKIAEELFGDPNKMIRIDMSEYMEKFNVSKLIGSAPGYVGYEEGGQLTEKVKNNPFSVILFDEIEKAHKDVSNILLQILDDGHLTDTFGRKVDFSDTVIIMTSNVGAKKVSDFGGGIGFETETSVEQEYETKRSVIRKALKQQFTPEFLNRIDDVILFNPLIEENLKKIIRLEINTLIERLKENKYIIGFDDSVIDKIFELNNEEGYGARPLIRVIQNLCEDFISEEILLGNITKNEDITISFENDLLKIVKN